MGIRSLVLSGITLDLYFYRNNRAAFISLMVWPYTVLGVILGAGYIFGSPGAFKRNVGVDMDPLTYFVASTAISTASLNALWYVGGGVLLLRWIGALPYVVLSPHRVSVTLVLSYLPRYFFTTSLLITEFAPLLMFSMGPSSGLHRLAILFLAAIIGMLPLLGFSAVLASFLIGVREERYALNIINPIILLFSGAFYPVYILPAWAQAVSWALPTTYTIELARVAAVLSSPRLSRITFLIAVLAGLSVVYNLLAYFLVGFSERSALRKGVPD